MKNVLTAMLALTALPLCGGNVPGELIIDTAVKGHDVSESMYGIFFEEINHSGDGGMYGELLQNRSFEEHVLPGGMYYSNGEVWAPQGVNSWVDNSQRNMHFGWNLDERRFAGWKVETSECTATYDVKELATPLHVNAPNGLSLSLSGAAAGSRADVINTGYWGVAVDKGANYDLRFYMRTSDFNGKLTAMICNGSGNAVAQADFTPITGGEWKEYTVTLTPNQTINDGTFRLRFSDGNGTVDLDYVSLFPQDTFKGRKNGMRRDVAELIEGLHPKFMRWPGGCVVEGITLGNRVKWKETIGDPMSRPGEYDLWGYRSTWGFGYHEFLQFCEDLGMDGMFVGNIGMACGGQNADYITTAEEQEPYINDIRDAIEYAIGDPATNEWAKKRAEAGHPEKFPLRYVELGNENFGTKYAPLFNRAYATLKAEYPEIIFINTMAHSDGAMQYVDKTDMVDPHWYVNPQWFYNSSTYEFDRLDRSQTPYTIYVGEYACNAEVGSGNLDAALSEAVFMINMERNSDIVKMTSYAPLISNQNWPNWAVNMIWLKNDQSLGRTSYHVQKMFAENRPDYNLRGRINSSANRSPYAGRIALGTFATTAEFRNVKCTSPSTGEVLYADDLSADNGNWGNPCDRGSWVYADGVLKQTNLDQSTYFTLNTVSFNDVVFEVEAKKTGGAEGFLINLGCNDYDINHSWRLNLGGWGNTKTNLEEATGYWGGTVGKDVSMKLVTNQWYKIKMVGEKGVIRCYLDDELIEEYIPVQGDVMPGRLSTLAGYDAEAGEVVVKVVNANAQELQTAVTLNAENIQPSGSVETLTGSKLYYENSFNEPTLISPVKETFSGFAKSFVYTFKPNSLTIFRIKADRAANALDVADREFTDNVVLLEKVPVTDYEKALDTLGKALKRAAYSNVAGANGTAQLEAAIAEGNSVYNDGNKTAAELYAAFDKLCPAMETFYQSNMVESKECTSAILNPIFTNGSSAGWRGSNVTLGSTVAEFYNCNFGFNQEVSGLENGWYMLTMQGFYRAGVNAWSDHQNHTEQLHALLIANEQSVPVRSRYTIGDFDENMWGASAMFKSADNAALNYIVVKVTDGKLSIALEKETTIERDWVCFDNFRLFRIADDAGIEAITTDRSEEITPNTPVYDVAGRYVGNYSQLRQLPKGIYIASGQKFVVR